MVFQLSIKLNVLDPERINGMNDDLTCYKYSKKKRICYHFRRKIASGMSHHRSAHALAKVSNIQNVEDYVYESFVASMDTY